MSDTAIPISHANAVLLAGVAAKLAIVGTERWRPDVQEQPLHQRARRVQGRWVPITLEELDHYTEAIETLREKEAGQVFIKHAEDAGNHCWTLAAAELPVTGQGAGLRWAHGAEPAVAAERAFRRVRGETDVPEPTERRVKPAPVYTRKSKRAA